MTKFIRLHLRIPIIEEIPLGNSYTTFQNGWDSKEVFFNINKIESFSDHKVNDIDVCETANEIIKELDNEQIIF